MLRAEYIFNPLHQGRTYSPENNIFFCITVDTCLLTEERVGKLEVKKHEGRGDDTRDALCPPPDGGKLSL